jgi:hypothetical protein
MAKVRSGQHVRQQLNKGFFMTYPFKHSLKILSLASLITLVGCGSMDKIAPGTPLQSVVSQYGQPSVECQNPNGTKRVVWTQEPAGEEAWAANVDASGGVSEFTQVLTADQFTVLNQGSWTAERVKCHFGPPAEVVTYRGNSNQAVWQYQYMGGGTDGFMMLYVTINKASNRVAGYSTGMNPNLNPLIIGD